MTKRIRSTLIISLALALVGLLVAACGADSDSAGLAKETDAPKPPNAKQPVIEESDIYKLSGTTLYLQNRYTGLNILDVSVPTKPRLLGRAPTGGGEGGELYLRPSQAIVLLKTATSACLTPQNLDAQGWAYEAEVDFVELSSKTHPKLIARYCIPGSLVASRTVDDVLYLVTSGKQGESRAISLDISDAHHARLLQTKQFPGQSKQISITAKMIMVAGESTSQPGSTDVQYIAINNKGDLTPKGSMTLAGSPQGRFHQQVMEGQFRIVTYDASWGRSKLYIIDIAVPEQLQLIGSLDNIGAGEKLYATRFTTRHAYVVTFKRTDPLWIIDLSDPANPKQVGELHVPGWSDFIFPRGDKLITVGRGDNGSGLGVSLFDVSVPSSPKSLAQVTLGSSDTTSEANVDHRAATILEPKGANPLVVVPHTVVSYGSSCDITDRLQLVEVGPASLTVRGSVGQKGTIRRSLMVESSLYSLSDHEVQAIDIKDRNNPRVDTTVTVGQGQWQDPNRSTYCSNWDNGYYPMYDDVYEDDGGYPFMFRCDLGAGAGAGFPLPPVTVLLGLAFLGVWVVRRRRR